MCIIFCNRSNLNVHRREPRQAQPLREYVWIVFTNPHSERGAAGSDEEA